MLFSRPLHLSLLSSATRLHRTSLPWPVITTDTFSLSIMARDNISRMTVEIARKGRLITVKKMIIKLLTEATFRPITLEVTMVIEHRVNLLRWRQMWKQRVESRRVRVERHLHRRAARRPVLLRLPLVPTIPPTRKRTKFLKSRNWKIRRHRRLRTKKKAKEKM